MVSYEEAAREVLRSAADEHLAALASALTNALYSADVGAYLVLDVPCARYRSARSALAVISVVAPRNHAHSRRLVIPRLCRS